MNYKPNQIILEKYQKWIRDQIKRIIKINNSCHLASMHLYYQTENKLTISISLN
jgi:hypothetical protein